jgi:hypothetical protein
MTEQEFVQFVKDECKYYGVKFKVGRGKRIKLIGDLPCSGYFDSDLKELAVALKAPGYLGILAHEYCHLTQWAEKADVWIRTNEEKSYVKWGEHIEGKKVDDMSYHFDLMRDLELDNEKRTVALIKKLKLPIDVKEYTKKANSYIMFYNYMKITGKWCSNRPPYTSQRLLNALPDKFSLDYTKLPKRLETIYREENF